MPVGTTAGRFSASPPVLALRGPCPRLTKSSEKPLVAVADRVKQTQRAQELTSHP